MKHSQLGAAKELKARDALQRHTSSSDLRRQQRHVREYERALKRGPPAAAVTGLWRTWLHRPVLQAIFKWMQTHVHDGSKEWYADVKLYLSHAMQGLPLMIPTGIGRIPSAFHPYDVESYEEYSGHDTWATSMSLEHKSDDDIPESS